MKREWYLYSVTSFAVAMFIFIVTHYRGETIAIALGLLAIIVQPFYSSNAWKLLSPTVHKSLAVISLLFTLGWIMHLAYINKILPRCNNHRN